MKANAVTAGTNSEYLRFFTPSSRGWMKLSPSIENVSLKLILFDHEIIFAMTDKLIRKRHQTSESRAYIKVVISVSRQCMSDEQKSFSLLAVMENRL